MAGKVRVNLIMEEQGFSLKDRIATYGTTYCMFPNIYGSGKVKIVAILKRLVFGSGELGEVEGHSGDE